MKLKREVGTDWISWYETTGKADAEVIKNPTFKEYFKIKEADGYVRGLYDYANDDIYIWRGEVLHRFIIMTLRPQCQTIKFVLETDSFCISNVDDGVSELSEMKPRIVNMLKEFEPLAKEEKGWKK